MDNDIENGIDNTLEAKKLSNQYEKIKIKELVLVFVT